MKLQILKYTCAGCGAIFDAPALAEGAYGEFLLWSRNGSMSYLNAFTDPTLKEVDNMLLKCNGMDTVSALERAKYLHRLYGRIACDPDVQGAPFEIDGGPPCPSCGCSSPGSWAFKEPTQLVDIDVPLVTHHRWYSLPEASKEEVLCTDLLRIIGETS